MLQRIQTVFMLLATLSPLFLVIAGGSEIVYGDFPVVTVVAVILILLGALSIFSYKNRNRQILLNNTGIIINALLIGLLVYRLLNLSGGESFPEKGIELVFPIIAVVLFVLANVYIRRDERLVKSVDRFR
ncbi:MAG: DUF4293 family protein [Chryseobacterium sp.]|nr:MAG: DUF4293 family protein [Chryseobacterium sp.]